MVNLIANAIRQHHAALANAGGVDADLFFGNASLTLRVIPLRSDIDATDAEGEPFTSQVADFGIGADQIIFDGKKIEPCEGMTIHADGRRYRVTPQGARCFDVMDSLGILYRVHTVCTGAAKSE